MIIQDDIFQHRVKFLHGKREDVMSEMKELGIQEDGLPGERDQGLVGDGKRCFVLWVKDPTDYPVLVHEIYHLVDEIFGFMGVDGENDSEFGACLAEFYMREICKHLAG